MRLVCADRSLVDGPGSLDEDESYRIGRSSKCAFILSDLSVSRFHAEVTVNERTVRVKDLGSRNGTFIDGVRIKEADIQPGQSVRFGTAHFQLVDDSAPIEPPEEMSGVSTHFMNGPPGAEPAFLKDLSDAERRVLDLLLKGLQEKEVAAQLGIRFNTAHTHTRRIYAKLGVSSRAELLALFIRD